MPFTLAYLLLAMPLGASPDDPPSIAASPAEAMTIDGVLNEASWTEADVATDFVQIEPTEGAPSSQTTRVRVLVSNDAIYVGAEMTDREPGAIRRPLSRRDDTGIADAFDVAIDSYNDGRTARAFGVTAAGVQFDALIEGDEGDDSWDAVWFSAVRLTPTGWTAEFRIPFSQLRFSGESQSWGINFRRVIPRLGEEAFWSPFPLEEADAGVVQFFGRLDGVAGVRPRRLLQVVPYTLASASRFESATTPGTAAFGDEIDVGADLKVGLTPGIVLDATVNPDFGQVEADPAELNLTTFETFFPERRPFFLEGTQIFDEGFSRDGALVYTRRIGAAAPVLAATKLTGRTASGLSFATLAAATGRSTEASEWFGVGRIRQEVRGGQSFVGGTVTAYDETSAACADRACTRSVLGAGDWQIRLGADEQYQAEGVLAGSIRDEDSGTARGFALYAGLDQVKGFGRFGSGFRVFSPGFRNNDVGSFRQTDLVRANLAYGVDWNRNEPFGPFRRLGTFVFGSATATYSDGTFRGGELGTFSSGQLRGFQDVGSFARIEGIGGYDVRETRGLGPVRNLLSVSGDVEISTDTRRQLIGGLELGFRLDAEGGASVFPEVSADWTVNDRLEVSATGRVEVSRDVRAWAVNEGFVRDADGLLYVGTEAGAPGDLGAADLVRLGLDASAVGALLEGASPSTDAVALPEATGYFLPVFGSRDTNGLDLTARATVIFRPTLSLQFYGQLFAARGQFTDFELLATADDLRPFDAYPKRRDFAFASFLTNTVLRWEYRPGSTLFVVWQHATGDDVFEEVLRTEAGDSPFERGTLGQFDDLFGTFADDVVLVKLSYLLQR
ncbi:MAG: DUF5916 domain-containing protein [Bacteroidota bacterium]